MPFLTLLLITEKMLTNFSGKILRARGQLGDHGVNRRIILNLILDIDRGTEQSDTEEHSNCQTGAMKVWKYVDNVSASTFFKIKSFKRS
jgi:hypothetical protein